MGQCQCFAVGVIGLFVLWGCGQRKGRWGRDGCTDHVEPLGGVARTTGGNTAVVVVVFGKLGIAAFEFLGYLHQLCLPVGSTGAGDIV